MKPIAKAFATSVILLGAFALFQAYAYWKCESALRFFIYLCLTIVGSGLKITLPTVRSTMSVNFFFVLVSIAQLSLGETVAIGACGFLTQYLWKSKSRPKLLQVAFNLSTAALAAGTSWHVFHWPLLRDAGLEFPLMMAAAAIAYFITNTCPVAIIIGLTEGQHVHEVWRDCYLWAFPYYLLGAAMAGAFDWGSKTAGWQVAVLGLPSLYLIYRSYNTYLKRLENEKRHAQHQREHAESISELHLRTIEALALAIEAKDQTTHDHLARVQIYALEIGRELKLNELELEALRAASLLHDIGKLAVPEHIISKPGRLTPEEFEKMKIHPTVGAEILEHVRFPYPVVPIVRAHHEKWDGTGYPSGLKGEEIPAGARILTAVDCFDALASDRQYRRALPIDEALAYVVKEAGKSFDPRVVEVLKRRHVELEAKARAEGAAPRPRLSTDVKVERGEAPAAGFESIEALPANTPARVTEFIDQIGAARQEAQVLFEVTGDMGSSLSLDATLSILASGLAKLVPFGGMAVYLRRGKAVHCEFAMGEGARLFSSLEIPIGQGLSGWVAENQKPIVNGNPAVEPGYLNDPRKFTALRSALAIPLEGATGPIGVLTLYDSAKDAFTRDHLRVVLAISSRLGVSIENALKYRQAEDGAVLDYLTQLPNARALFVRLQEEVQNCTLQKLPLTVLVGDLDGFKSVNDHHGHLEGNRLLQVLAAALKAQCRPQDYVARMGGDEFAIILHGAGGEDASLAAKRFCDAVVDAVKEQPQFSNVSLSLGAATLGDDGEHPEELLAAADRRMYKAKSNRKRNNTDLMRLNVAIQEEITQAESVPTNVQCGV